MSDRIRVCAKLRLRETCLIKLTFIFWGVVCIGCGSPSDEKSYQGKLVPITGTLTLDGKPLAEAKVNFSMPDKPPDGFAGATGITDSNGKYMLRTGAAAGVPPGRYRVTLERWATPDGSPFKEDPENGIDTLQAQMSGRLKQLIPEKYNDPSQAQFTVTVAEDHKEPVNFDLKSK